MNYGRHAHPALIACAVAFALAGAGCSSHKTPPLAKDCATVFAGTATSAEDSCSGSDGTIHIAGADCHSGPRFMLAESTGGSDYAWARVGQPWHVLTEEQTSAGAFRQCHVVVP